jgi:hypothetical protein
MLANDQIIRLGFERRGFECGVVNALQEMLTIIIRLGFERSNVKISTVKNTQGGVRLCRKW